MQERKLVNHHKLAEILDMPDQSVWRMARLGRIPVVKIGRNYRFDPQLVLAALEARSEESGAVK